MQELKQEREHLEKTISEYQKVTEETIIKYENVPKQYKSTPELAFEMSKMFGMKIDLLNKNQEKPYFARIDFESKENNVCYISKVGIYDSDNRIITVDWRAPIANLYYDSNVGSASYEAPEGIIKGVLTTKRQYEIENKELISYQDVDTVSNDEILKPYLNASADNRLKNIVTTIQTEQNQIIREKNYKNIIIQGVAGSGKTTVALHRIAYLVYNHLKTINPDQYLVIGPNKFFVNYISNVLPDLDVNNVNQLTYEELVEKFIKEKITLLSNENTIKRALTNPETLIFEKLRLSMEYKKALKKYMNDYIKNILPEEDLIIKGYKVLSKKEISKIYDETNNQIIKEKVERTILLLSKYIKDNYGRLKNKIDNSYHLKIEQLNKEDIMLEKKKYEAVIKELTNLLKPSLKTYFKKSTVKVFNLYIDFINNIDNYLLIDETIKEQFINHLKNIKKKQVEYEDLSALAYLYYKTYGRDELNKYRHTVIDEAQDYGEFDFYILKKILSKTTFSIFGDIAQSIYEYRSIKNWEEVSKIMFNNNSELFYLLKSYRTTVEIMSEANKTIKHIGLKESLPVLRHNKEVIYEPITNKINQIIDFIKYSLKKDYKTVAIISKTEEESNYIYKELLNNKINVVNINDSNTTYSGGICTLTSSLAKGLEFDTVIISDASKQSYNQDKTIDMKLLYVSMTRPLHELKVLYNKELCEVL